jgi:hypothetical protein
MGQWYENNRRQFREVKEELASACPFLTLAVVGPGFRINSAYMLKEERAVAYGIYTLNVPDTCREIEYGIVLVFPGNYPKTVPQMYCNDQKLPIGNIDRHIMPDGWACLAVRAEIRVRWPTGSTMVNFLDNLVAPYLAWQAYYDAHQKPPPWGERTHGTQGIQEFYAELLGRQVDSSVVGFMRLLARKNRPKGHEPCPCNSGKRLRNCHRDLVYDARQRVAWQNVEHDLVVLARADSAK